MKLPGGWPGTRGKQGKGPDPLRVRNQKQFRDALNQLRGGKSYKAIATASKGDLPSTTIYTVLTKDALPAQDFVVKYLPACGLSEADQTVWLRCWETLSNQPVPPAGHGRRWEGLLGGGRRWLRTGLAAGAALLLAAAIVAWQVHKGNLDRFKSQHCGTSSPDLVTGKDRECTGVTDGSDGSAVFGDDLKPVMEAIAAENSDVTDGGDYVTFAFLTPLSSTDANALTVGQYVAELEGAYTAVEEENKKDSRPKIRLLVASMGSSELAWKTAVDKLKARKDAEHLVAVAGLGLSQQETVDATRELSKAGLPMVGDLITADGFDATGAVDGKGPINGLARVALSNTDQLTAISKTLGSGRRTAALISTKVTPNGTRDPLHRVPPARLSDHRRPEEAPGPQLRLRLRPARRARRHPAHHQPELLQHEQDHRHRLLRRPRQVPAAIPRRAGPAQLPRPAHHRRHRIGRGSPRPQDRGTPQR
ncbi:hypothetical protein [Streptomyces sp. NRRL S-1022]|uniref:hypothetical protein n=1 Tax=Streptomyces sp. NRRL S-1022 TaxID=1463880 RepID=UPI000AC07124|nr:hypothetical protein [Streptomyces sp. NRRL S-1022]